MLLSLHITFIYTHISILCNKLHYVIRINSFAYCNMRKYAQEAVQRKRNNATSTQRDVYKTILSFCFLKNWIMEA